jgi:hypothetical protein
MCEEKGSEGQVSGGASRKCHRADGMGRKR